MNVIQHLNLAGQNMLSCLSTDDNYLPYWHMSVDADARAAYEFRPHCNGHNIGRWWNAMLRLEKCTGFEIPEDVETCMLENTWRLTDNPTGILLDDPIPGDPGSWYIHSYRETMLALGLLAKYRNLDRAKSQGLEAVKQMGKACIDLESWDLSRCDASSESLKLSGRGSEPAYTHGRAIEGLYCFYHATGEPAALNEAKRIADFHFKHTVCRDGSLASGSGHHTHSYLNTLRGLLLLSIDTGDADRVESIRNTYNNAVSHMITQSGYIKHDIGDYENRSGGDIASAGDIAHIALLLWDHFRDSALLDDVERIVRCRLIPAQVLTPMPVVPGDDSGRNCHRDLAQRFVGAIGGSVGQVRGQTCVTDFTASALHTLIEFYNRTVDVDESSVRVNFHFDWDGPNVQVRSTREGTKARLEVQCKARRHLSIRIPQWAPRTSLRLSIDKVESELNMKDGYVVVGKSQRTASEGGNSDADRTRLIRFSYDLPEYETGEPWRDTETTVEFLTFHWRGDEIMRVDPVGAYLEPHPKICKSLANG